MACLGQSITLKDFSAPGIRFGFTGDTVAVTFGDLTISSTLVAYRLSGLDWAFTNVTAGATHLFIRPETEGTDQTGPISPHTFEMRVTNWGYGVQIGKVHVAAGHKLVKLHARPRSIEFIGDSLASGMHNSYEALAGFAYGVGEGFGNTEYSITAIPGICVSDQECWGNLRGQSHQWFYTTDTSWRATEMWGGELEYPHHLSEFGEDLNLIPRCQNEPEPWNFSKQQAADLVVINLGTNDANVANNVSASTYVEHYKRLIQGVHGVWPDAQVIIMVCPSFPLFQPPDANMAAEDVARLLSGRQHLLPKHRLHHRSLPSLRVLQHRRLPR